MASVVACLFAFGLQQLQVTPPRAEVGDEIVVRALRAAEPIRDLAIELVAPDGTRRVCGTTSASGEVCFVASAAGEHVAAAAIDGARVVAPFRVQPARPRLLLALGAVPLGLAFLWVSARGLSRARGRRGP